jgi:hypothetical protein
MKQLFLSISALVLLAGAQLQETQYSEVKKAYSYMLHLSITTCHPVGM